MNKEINLNIFKYSPWCKAVFPLLSLSLSELNLGWLINKWTTFSYPPDDALNNKMYKVIKIYEMKFQVNRDKDKELELLIILLLVRVILWMIFLDKTHRSIMNFNSHLISHNFLKVITEDKINKRYSITISDHLVLHLCLMMILLFKCNRVLANNLVLMNLE